VTTKALDHGDSPVQASREQMMAVLVFPPSAGCRMRVSLLSLKEYGLCKR